MNEEIRKQIIEILQRPIDFSDFPDSEVRQKALRYEDYSTYYTNGAIISIAISFINSYQQLKNEPLSNANIVSVSDEMNFNYMKDNGALRLKKGLEKAIHGISKSAKKDIKEDNYRNKSNNNEIRSSSEAVGECIIDERANIKKLIQFAHDMIKTFEKMIRGDVFTDKDYRIGGKNQEPIDIHSVEILLHIYNDFYKKLKDIEKLLDEYKVNINDEKDEEEKKVEDLISRLSMSNRIKKDFPEIIKKLYTIQDIEKRNRIINNNNEKLMNGLAKYLASRDFDFSENIAEFWKYFISSEEQRDKLLQEIIKQRPKAIFELIKKQIFNASDVDRYIGENGTNILTQIGKSVEEAYRMGIITVNKYIELCPTTRFTSDDILYKLFVIDKSNNLADIANLLKQDKIDFETVVSILQSLNSDRIEILENNNISITKPEKINAQYSILAAVIPVIREKYDNEESEELIKRLYSNINVIEKINKRKRKTQHHENGEDDNDDEINPKEPTKKTHTYFDFADKYKALTSIEPNIETKGFIDGYIAFILRDSKKVILEKMLNEKGKPVYGVATLVIDLDDWEKFKDKFVGTERLEVIRKKNRYGSSSWSRKNLPF